MKEQTLESKDENTVILTDETYANGLFTISDELLSDNMATLALAGIDIEQDKLFDMSIIEEVYEENPELGPEQSFEADAYLIRSFPDPILEGYEVEPTIVEWPAAAPSLADATECLAVPADQVGDVLADANQLTFFTSDGATYQIAAKPQLPGDGC